MKLFNSVIAVVVTTNVSLCKAQKPDYDNTITNLSHSMRFLSDCDFTLLRANEMTGYDKAIRLDGAALPDQFQYDNTWGVKQPLDNIWNDPATGNGQPTDRVDGTLSSGTSFINWFYPNSGTGYNPLEGGMTSPIIYVIDRPAALVACDDYTNRESNGTESGEKVSGSFVGTQTMAEKGFNLLKLHEITSGQYLMKIISKEGGIRYNRLSIVK